MILDYTIFRMIEGSDYALSDLHVSLMPSAARFLMRVVVVDSSAYHAAFFKRSFAGKQPGK